MHQHRAQIEGEGGINRETGKTSALPAELVGQFCFSLGCKYRVVEMSRTNSKLLRVCCRRVVHYSQVPRFEVLTVSSVSSRI